MAYKKFVILMTLISVTSFADFRSRPDRSAVLVVCTAVSPPRCFLSRNTYQAGPFVHRDYY